MYRKLFNRILFSRFDSIQAEICLIWFICSDLKMEATPMSKQSQLRTIILSALVSQTVQVNSVKRACAAAVSLSDRCRSPAGAAEGLSSEHRLRK